MCMGLRGMLIALRAHKPRHLVQLQLQNVTEICMQSATPKQQMPDSRGYKNKTYIVHTYIAFIKSKEVFGIMQMVEYDCSLISTYMLYIEAQNIFIILMYFITLRNPTTTQSTCHSWSTICSRFKMPQGDALNSKFS